MKKIIILELCLMLFATTFKSDKMTGWIQQTIPRPDLPVLDLYFTDSLTGIFVSSKYSPSDSAFIYRTINGGNNWITSFVDNIYLTSVQLVDDGVGYCAGRDVIPINGIIKKTTNSGSNWITQSLIGGSGLLMDLFFVNPDTGWVCSTDIIAGGVWRTTDGGISWQKQLNETYRPSKIFFVNENTGWVIGNAGQNLYRTINSGINWSSIANFSSNTISDVFFVSVDTGYTIGGGGGTGIMRSINGGINWHPCNNPTPYGGAKLFFINNNSGWVGNRPNNILVTKDGYNWGYQYSPIYTSYNISFIDTSIGWAGYSGLVHTTDGGGAIVSVNNENTVVPENFILEQNYPNPFNSMTNVKWQMLNSGKAVIAVYDISGKEIAVLVNKYKPAGSYSVKFSGSGLPSGIYFCRLSVDGKSVSTKKMILAK